MKDFSNKWISSSNPGKQRKYRYNAPIHKKRNMLSARLSKELSKKYNKRSMPVRKGDRVKIVRGQYSGILGKIDRLNIKKERIYIEGTDRIKRDGTKSLYPIHPSNTIIQELNMGDKKRKQVMERIKAK